MDTIKIALETILVGALALPWLILLVQLFFPSSIPWLLNLPKLCDDQLRSSVLGVLLLALGYCFGAAISRLAEDFFNDDDLILTVTEDQIRSSAYCDQHESGLVQAAVPFQEDSDKYSAITSRWFIQLCSRDTQSIRDRVRQIFNLQENALLLDGDDKTSRLRIRHQQIMVLRGAAYNGLLACLLCALGWNMQKQHWRRRRWILPVAIVLVALATYCLHLSLGDAHALHFPRQILQVVQHPLQALQRSEADDPPFIEITLLLVGVGGCLLLRKQITDSWCYGTGFWAALVPTLLFYAGWYWTEIQYDRMVLYSYFAQSHNLLKGP